VSVHAAYLGGDPDLSYGGKVSLSPSSRSWSLDTAPSRRPPASVSMAFTGSVLRRGGREYDEGYRMGLASMIEALEMSEEGSLAGRGGRGRSYGGISIDRIGTW